MTRRRRGHGERIGDTFQMCGVCSTRPGTMRGGAIVGDELEFFCAFCVRPFTPEEIKADEFVQTIVRRRRRGAHKDH